MRRVLLLCLLVQAPGQLAMAQPGTCSITGQIKTSGMPRGPVVVYVLGDGPAPTAPTSASIGQRNKAFDQPAVIVSEGARVDFPNMDRVHHHLYSHTPGNAFEFEQHRRGARPAQEFHQSGDVKVKCNIHKNMETHVLVLPNAWAVEVSDDGTYTLAGVAPGTREVEAWSAWHEPVRRTVRCRSGTSVQFDTKLRWRSPSLDGAPGIYAGYK